MTLKIEHSAEMTRYEWVGCDAPPPTVEIVVCATGNRGEAPAAQTSTPIVLPIRSSTKAE